MYFLINIEFKIKNSHFMNFHKRVVNVTLGVIISELNTQERKLEICRETT